MLASHPRMPPTSPIDNYAGLVSRLDQLLENSPRISARTETPGVSTPVNLTEADFMPDSLKENSTAEQMAAADTLHQQDEEDLFTDETEIGTLAFNDEMPKDSPDHSPPTEDSMDCLLYTSPSPRDGLLSRMPSSA